MSGVDLEYWTICLSFLGLVVSFAAIVPELDMKTWWVRNWIYGRQQIFWILFFIIGLYVTTVKLDAFYHGAILTIMVAALIYAFSSIYPYLPIFSKQNAHVKTSNKFTDVSLLIANVLQDNKRYDDLLQIIEAADPDIVFLSEVDEAWVNNISSLKDRYAHHVELPGKDYNGLCLYSRCPIMDVQTRYLVQEHVPSFLMDVALQSDVVLKLFALHPRPPRPEDAPEKLDQELRIVAHEAYESELPVIVTGDLNEVGWSRALRRFEQMSGLRDAQCGRMICNSYNAKIPLVRWPLDHAYHSPDIILKTMKRLPKFGSDHFPVMFEFHGFKAK